MGGRGTCPHPATVVVTQFNAPKRVGVHKLRFVMMTYETSHDGGGGRVWYKVNACGRHCAVRLYRIPRVYLAIWSRSVDLIVH